MENQMQSLQDQKRIDLRKITEKVSYVYLVIFALVVLFHITPLIVLGYFLDNIVGSVIWYLFLAISVVVFILTFLDFRKRPWSIVAVVGWCASVFVLLLYGGNFKFLALAVALPFSITFLTDKNITTRLFSWLVIIALIFAGMIILAPRFF